MSNTRKQDPETKTFRQDAFASAAEFERGIYANLVATRCQLLSNPEAVSVLWWLKDVSWRDGGLNAFAREFLPKYAELIGTKSMHKFGRRPGQIYNSDQVTEIRRELYIRNQHPSDVFPLKDDLSVRATYAITTVGWQIGARAMAERREELEAEAARHPSEYPASAFIECCTMEPEAFAEELKHLLVNPKTNPEAGLWNMPGLLSALIDFRAREIEHVASRIVTTDVTKRIFEALDFALEQRACLIIEGREGIGKTEGAETWCALHPGQVIYIKMEAGTDDKTFYRCIARQVHTAMTLKPAVVRARIEDALQPAHVMLVIDESHFAWPQSGRSERGAPRRIDWLRGSIIDYKVTVVLIATPQYFKQQCDRFRKAGWNANQIERRLTDTVTLPEQLETKDVLAVARARFPALDETTLKRIAAYALGSVGYLTSIKHVHQLASFELSRNRASTMKEAVEIVLKKKGMVFPVSNPPAGSTAKEVVSTPVNPPLSLVQRGLNVALPSPQLSGSRVLLTQEVGI